MTTRGPRSPFSVLASFALAVCLLALASGCGRGYQLCDDALACGAGETCFFGAPGYSGVCTPTCSDDADCGEGGICVEGTLCLYPCVRSDDCAQGLTCAEPPGESFGLCVPVEWTEG